MERGGRSGGRVVVCDDTEQIRRLIRVNLGLEGMEVEEVSDGEALLDLLHASDTLPDVITLDAQMNPRDGWWAIKRIRREPRFAAIPVVMVTASVQEHDRIQASHAGLDAFIAKPFDPDYLVKLVMGFMAEGRAYQPEP
jgi:CheY-like chemotaxis protein